MADGLKAPPPKWLQRPPQEGVGGGMKLSVVAAEKWVKNKGLEFI